MTEFEGKFFTKFKFTGEQVVRYFQNALRDLSIARDDKHIEVKFNYAFNALIKAGIALMAAKGVKIRSVPGHHVKLIEKTAEIVDTHGQARGTTGQASLDLNPGLADTLRIARLPLRSLPRSKQNSPVTTRSAPSSTLFPTT